MRVWVRAFERPRRTILRRFVPSLVVLIALPALVALIVLYAGETWFPGGDMAQAELHLRGFFAHPPLVGAAGRIVSDSGVQGSHPGPSLWLAMLPVYVVGGRTSASLMAAVVSVHVVSATAMIWLAQRRGGRSLALLTAMVVLVFIRSSGPDFLFEPWNPWLALLPFGVYVFLLAEVIQPTTASWRSRRPLVFAAAVLVGSHCVQCHAGYALLVLGSLLVALVLVAGSFSRPSSTDRSLTSSVRTVWQSLRPSIIVGALGGLLIWTPPLLDQIRREPGNLEILWQHFGSPNEPTLALTRVAREVSTQLNLLGPWLTGPGSRAPAQNWARYPGFVAFLVLLGWSWRRARKNDLTNESAMLTITGSLMVLGALSISRIFGPFYEYTIRWVWILVALMVGVSILIQWRTLDERRRRRWKNSATKLAVVSTVTLCAITTGQIADRVKLPGATDSVITAGLIDELEPALDEEQRYLVRFYDPYTLNATGFGLVLALERAGFDVGVEPAFAAAALPHRTRSQQDVDRVLWVVVGPAIDTARRDPSLTLEAYVNPRTPREQLRAEELLLEIAEGLERTGRGDLVAVLEAPGASLIFVEPPLEPDVAALVRELIAMGQPVAVFSIPSGQEASSLE